MAKTKPENSGSLYLEDERQRQLIYFLKKGEELYCKDI